MTLVKSIPKPKKRDDDTTHIPQIGHTLLKQTEANGSIIVEPVIPQHLRGFPAIVQHYRELLHNTKDPKVFPHYFFPVSQSHTFDKELQRWQDAFGLKFADVVPCPGYGLHEKSKANVEWLRHEFGLSRTALEGQCKAIFATMPGKLLLTCRLFLLSLRGLDYEKKNNSRSALNDMRGDFRRSFRRVLGMAFSEFREEIKRKHPIDVWIDLTGFEVRSGCTKM